ncbi:MAG: OmpA family protein [Burkholderiales bacterium]|nr:OmpA family protein [Burkholderiales bacterium]
MNRRALTGLAVAAALLPGVALAADSKNQGYLVDTITGNIVTSATTGLCVRTSDWTPARAVAQCDPDLVKKAPPPAPKPEAKPAPKPEAKPKPKKPAMMNVELKLSVQNFDFDKATMRDDQRKEIDEWMTKQWKGVTLGALIVTGHTDRIGSAAYNKKLSEARAQTVKDYVVGKGVDQKLIFWEGKGFANPVPVTKFCDNKMSRKQLIECLAPNRRVDIEAVGQKPKPAPKPKPETKPEAKPEAKPKP